MVGKERWRKHAKGLDIEGFPKAWIGRGLREIHHIGDQMDGRMDACLRYTAVLGAEIYESIGELRDELREDQTLGARASGNGWTHARNIERTESIFLACFCQTHFMHI